jgi:hypothetical protein
MTIKNNKYLHMKNKHTLLVIIFLSLLIVSCKKEPEQLCGSCPVGGSTESNGFSYTENGGSTTRADSAFFNPSTRIITGYYQGMTNRIIIKTSSMALGTYNFTTTANTLSYIKPLGTYNATGGYINITSNANNKLSGNFVSNGGGSASTISGQFKDIPKK